MMMFRPKGGRSRSEYGQYLDSRGINQKDIEEETGHGKNTLTRACGDGWESLNASTKKSLWDAARKLGR